MTTLYDRVDEIESPKGPDPTYVTRLLNDLKLEMEGAHRRIEETERIRYLEDDIQLQPDEQKSGIEVRIGASAELIENVKSAITTNPPRTKLTPHSNKADRGDNAAKRERFYNRVLERLNGEVPTLTTFADSIIGLGTGILKAARVDYPADECLIREGESAKDHVDRVKAQKRVWGLPIEVINIHPLSIYWRLGQGNRASETVEHSWKPKVDIYRNYGINDVKDWQARNPGKLLGKNVGQLVRSETGIPDQDIKPFPYGVTTTNLCLVTEYWSRDFYQVYVDRRLIHEEHKPEVEYFISMGRVSSSTDRDKAGFGVAEIMRHNEPTINRIMTRMAEASELIVHKRLTLEVPQGSPDLGMELDREQGREVPRTYTFRPDAASSLPEGHKIVDPYEGVENVFDSLPLLEMLLRIVGQHGVSPLFKGTPPSANGSGYRDNSLYLMAKSQLQYVIDAYAGALTRLMRWVEKQILELNETVYIDELELTPKDIRDYPAELIVQITPMLPQNMIAEGAFWDRMWASRHVPRRVVRERGFNEEDPDGLEREVLLEDIREALKPSLITDVLSSVIGLSMQQNGEPTPGSDTASSGQTSSPPRNGNAVREGVGRGMGQEVAGYSSAGTGREPAVPAGATPGMEGY